MVGPDPDAIGLASVMGGLKKTPHVHMAAPYVGEVSDCKRWSIVSVRLRLASTSVRFIVKPWCNSVHVDLAFCTFYFLHSCSQTAPGKKPAAAKPQPSQVNATPQKSQVSSTPQKSQVAAAAAAIGGIKSSQGSTPSSTPGGPKRGAPGLHVVGAGYVVRVVQYEIRQFCVFYYWNFVF